MIQYVENNSIDTDYKKGEFLHLYTDYVFYTQYLIHLDSYLTIEDKYKDLNDMLYTEYDRVMHWIGTNYKLKYLSFIPAKFTKEKQEDMVLFDSTSLKRVIDYLSDTDIDRVYNVIKNSKGKFSLDLHF